MVWAMALYNLAFAHDQRRERGLAQAAAGEAVEIRRKLVAGGWTHLQQDLGRAEALVARLDG